ncbi:hypothetical protein MsAg5_15740 [Methanosarcinaceae archaeon Ag5]|uniref:Uncharacterized protein n=1 Tax=Methanolapillus africanus TaxID=3028297 RepID=A0AAE4MMA3_9EURY|nr:hypothetical protein [Methanosarcinaceae archaeon Ag5]
MENEKINNKKTPVSISISEDLLAKVNQLVETEDFASISDIVFTSLCSFFGKIAVYENDPEFEYKMLLAASKEDRSPKKQISVSLNRYLIKELKFLSQILEKNQSFIIRIAIVDYMESYTTTRKLRENTLQENIKSKSEKLVLISEKDLEKSIREIIEKMYKKQ